MLGLRASKLLEGFMLHVQPPRLGETSGSSFPAVDLPGVDNHHLHRIQPHVVDICHEKEEGVDTSLIDNKKHVPDNAILKCTTITLCVVRCSLPFRGTIMSISEMLTQHLGPFFKLGCHVFVSLIIGV